MNQINQLDHQTRLAFQQAQKLDATHLLSRTLIHELKNCLGGISGAAELIDFEAEEHQAIRDLCKVIMSSTENAITAINTMSDFLQHQADSAEEIDLHAFLHDQLRFYQACLGKHIPIELHLHAPQHHLRCDAILLAHNCMNIVLNANESIDERGQVSISTEVLTVEEQARSPFQQVKPGQYLDLCFADTGSGVDIQDLNTLCHAGFSRKEHHAGMGLHLAESFMRQQAGYICFESGKNLGTKVHLLFPL